MGRRNWLRRSEIIYSWRSVRSRKLFTPAHEGLGVNRYILNDAADGAIWTRPVRRQVPTQREEKAEQLAEHDVHGRTAVIRHRSSDFRRKIAIRETIQRQF